MNCGIEVLKRLNQLIEIELDDVILNCEHKLSIQGLSMYDLKTELDKKIKTMAVASLKLIHSTPYIAFIGFDFKGHYVLVEHIDSYVHIYDPAIGFRTLSKFHFYWIWSKKALLLCYNDKEVAYDNLY